MRVLQWIFILRGLKSKSKQTGLGLIYAVTTISKFYKWFIKSTNNGIKAITKIWAVLIDQYICSLYFI